MMLTLSYLLFGILDFKKQLDVVLRFQQIIFAAFYSVACDVFDCVTLVPTQAVAVDILRWLDGEVFVMGAAYLLF